MTTANTQTAEIYTPDQVNKLGNALIYLCERIQPVSKTHLLKLVFIIEEISVKKFGIPFFDLRFDVWKLGPVSKNLFVELSDELVLLADFITKTTAADNTVTIVPKKPFADDEFSDNEVLLLDEIVSRFKYCTARELINFTHRKGTPWYNTALRNGVLDDLESGKLTTTDIEINLEEVIEDEDDKLALFKSHKDFLQFSKNLKS